MSGVRAIGGGLPNLLKINGQLVDDTQVTPVEGKSIPVGATPGVGRRPVEAPADPYALQEQVYDRAHQASLRGERAAARLNGNKRRRARDVRKKDKGFIDALLGDSGSEPVSGVFSDADPHHRQERAYEIAAEFEERVKDGDLSFKRKSAQVEVGHTVFASTRDDQQGSVISGETAFEWKQETVPDIKIDAASDTMLRRVLGLDKQFKPNDR